MEIDSSEAVSKYKDLRQRKKEADGKYVTAEKELADNGVRELKLMAKKLLMEQNKREKTEQRLQLLQTGLAEDAPEKFVN